MEWKVSGPYLQICSIYFCNLYCSRDCYVVVDKAGRIIAVLAGKPRDDAWDAVMTKLTAQIKDARGGMTFSKKQEAHKRGKFPSVAVGTSFGGGSKV